MVPDDPQAPFLKPSGNSFGIVRHQFWDRQAPVLGSQAFALRQKQMFFRKTDSAIELYLQKYIF